MVRIGIGILILFISAAGVSSQSKISREQYIDNYAELAMREMVRTGIPASIKIAQGCLESDNGNSRLAREANNHFGIKCHDWNGRKIRHDDDEKNECFRVYKSVYDSFEDHSEFLTSKSRYAELFNLRQDDYKGWARGLKKAGYATSSKYAELLIRIIEENELYKYDQMVLRGDVKFGEEKPGSEPLAGRPVMLNNNIEYVIAQPGDTPQSLRRELDLYPREIYRYNDIGRGYPLDSGMRIYIQPKRYRAEKGNDTHTVNEGETMWDISQHYGVKLQRLYRMNNIQEGDQPEPGTTLWLRKKRRDSAAAEIMQEDPGDDDQEIRMEFDDF